MRQRLEYLNSLSIRMLFCVFNLYFYPKDKWNKLSTTDKLKWLGNIFFFTAALFYTSKFEFGYFESAAWASPIFLLGHVLFCFIFWKRDAALLWQNLVFVGVDLWGIYRWILS